MSRLVPYIHVQYELNPSSMGFSPSTNVTEQVKKKTEILLPKKFLNLKYCFFLLFLHKICMEVARPSPRLA